MTYRNPLEITLSYLVSLEARPAVLELGGGDLEGEEWGTKVDVAYT